MSVLDVQALSKAFGGVKAVQNVSFSLEAGDLLALIGPNGAGKSTCFNMIGGQLPPDHGRITILGQDVTGWPPRKIWRLGVGRTFQITATMASMTVLENVQLAIMSHHRRLGGLIAPARRLYRDEAMAVLERLGIGAEAGRACAVLAYGDLKRVELAVALANEPQLLLMDEPTAGMAPAERQELMALVADIARAEKIGVLFTEHDMDVVFEHAARIMVLARGELIADGTPADVRADKQVQTIYLGESVEA